MLLKIVVKDRFDRFGDRFNIFLWFLYVDIIAYNIAPTRYCNHM